MRLVFAGTPPFAVPALDALRAAGHEIAAVYSQPDRPAGRGRELTPSAVKSRALELGLPVKQPVKFTPEATAELAALAPEAMVVVAYGLILPRAVLDIPTRGCFNIHASILPRWRGAAPIQRAVLAGDRDSGVTIMRMDEGLDTGAMLLTEIVPVKQKTSGQLTAELSKTGAALMVQALASLDTLHEVAQPAEGVTYAKKISKDEARIDWALPAEELARRVRGYNPAPVAWTQLEGERVKIYRAMAVSGSGKPGMVLRADSEGIVVAAGDDALSIGEIQWPGGKPMSAAQATSGRLLPGKIFD